MKIGIEVEGRYKGIETLFCGAVEFLEYEYDFANFPVSHVYISDHENYLNIADAAMFNRIPSWMLITVERTSVMVTPSSRIHVILNVLSSSIWNMRPTDQVKFDLNQTVYAIPLEMMYKTKPEDFVGDVTL